MIAQMNNTSVPVPATVLMEFWGWNCINSFNPTKKYISAEITILKWSLISVLH
jgi:hypothetical protein